MGIRFGYADCDEWEPEESLSPATSTGTSKAIFLEDL
jgi:hypothetical protein